jgi:uncharacterized protein YndB with AHSA1/START domain
MANPTAKHAIFTVEQRYDAPPAAIFAAFATEEGKRPWFAEGEGWFVENFSLDFRQGGRESSTFRFGDGAPMGNETVYFDIVEDRRIVFAYSMLTEGKPFSTSLATVELAPDGAGTRLTLTEQVAFLDGGDTIEDRKAGWTVLLERLGESVVARRRKAA